MHILPPKSKPVFQLMHILPPKSKPLPELLAEENDDGEDKTDLNSTERNVRTLLAFFPLGPAGCEEEQFPVSSRLFYFARLFHLKGEFSEIVKDNLFIAGRRRSEAWASKPQV